MSSRYRVVIPSKTAHPAKRLAQPFSKRNLLWAARAMAPALFALALSGVAHAQGTMDFSQATTLMGTFKTFCIYAGAVCCFGGLIFAGIRMMSGRFQEAIPGLFGALFGAGVLGWGAGWIGYSQEYLVASSLRSEAIRDALEKSGHRGSEAAEIAAHATRERKQVLPREEVLTAHREVAEWFGNQHEAVIAEARERARSQQRKPDDFSKAQEAVTYAKSSIFEREAVADERGILRDALRRGMGETTYAAVRAEFDTRQSRGEFRQVQGRKHDTGRAFTTPETIANERANVAHVMRGQNILEPILSRDQAAAQAEIRTFLNPAQKAVIQDVLTSPDRIHGLQGLAGTGKTTVLESIREGAERSGYTVEGFAPSSRAAGQLRDAGISATSLQSFLVRSSSHALDAASRHLYMLDESSLASTKQMRAFLDKISPEDRVLVIGDTRQHQAVDAGRPFQQMQEAGMRTSKLTQIMRQQDPELLKAVEYLAKGETATGVKMLADQGRITEIASSKDRIEAIAKDYAAKPDITLIVSPDNRSRQAINQAVRVELQASGTLAKDSHEFSTLAHRSDMTGADRMWAARYNTGDVLQYTTGSKANGIERGSYAAVQSVNPSTNTLTIQREDGEVVSYDPKRLKGVNVYREVQREIAAGERVQFTTSHKGLEVANRDLGTVTRIEHHQITVRMDGKGERTISFDPKEMRHFDHGYAVTSHSSQGLTAGRIIANMDGETARSLINTRLAYVAISRASEDARIYTNDAATIGQRLATDITKTAAVEFRPAVERVYTPAEVERHHAPMREALEPEDAIQFKWKGETGAVQTYRHTETGRNIHIDSKGNFYSQDGKPTSQDAALDRAMPAGRAHSQNEYENSLGLGR